MYNFVFEEKFGWIGVNLIIFCCDEEIFTRGWLLKVEVIQLFHDSMNGKVQPL
jgi:hypothetical protein